MGHLLKIKCVDSKGNVHILASTSVSFTVTTVQVPNLARNGLQCIGASFAFSAKNFSFHINLEEPLKNVKICCVPSLSQDLAIFVEFLKPIS
jgi:hypothetical protein